ncbi:hypothetical protein [Nocardioides flavescens]|uniref:Uncharacterized protein n=1 Tax=Nocardioides flavescens TaxID=2691959 RepID=A0A6L7EX76_9ACTN|nr:hypothetical protein [Nocardioides flavescens]MXG90466.1 hypothetical protein [Nocardioides flavescens]
MSDPVSTTSTEILHRPEVSAFVAQVRSHLVDLDVDARDELTEGLEADLAEQHASGEPLPDPAAYAAELRAAAGLPSAVGHRSRVAQLTADLDTLRTQFLAWVESDTVFTRTGWSVVSAARPAWWVLRAWIAVTLLDQLVGPWEYVTLWPTLGASLVGPLLLVVAVVMSVLIGQGRLWPGSGPDRPFLARAVLVVLNAVAVLAPFTFNGDATGSGHAYAVAVPATADRKALVAEGRVVSNIYAYDDSGQPVTGIQLFDQVGRPLTVSPRGESGMGRDREVVCPWFNGTTPLWNVFPLQQRAQRSGTCAKAPANAAAPAYDQPPLDSVPPVGVAPLGAATASP